MPAKPKKFMRGRKILPMSRTEYEKFTKTLPGDTCLFCEYKIYQPVIKEWKYWALIQPISPYFNYHAMLLPKRHVRFLYELSVSEQKEFWIADRGIHRAYEKLGINKLRLQYHARFTNRMPKNWKVDSREHLHIHYYRFREGDFEILISKNAHRQNLAALLGRIFAGTASLGRGKG
jgi:diadenosine tetraphosphate (Ap4A) HIT family hydrolase